MRLKFNIRNVPRDLELIHSTLRLYMKPILTENVQAEVSIYQLRLIKVKEPLPSAGQSDQPPPLPFRVTFVDSVNTSSLYTGWLEFNTTKVLERWLKQRHFSSRRSQLLVTVKLLDTKEKDSQNKQILPSAFGLVPPRSDDNNSSQSDFSSSHESYHPFIIGYFKGPQLYTKIQQLTRRRRDVKMEEKPVSKETAEQVNAGAHVSDLFPPPPPRGFRAITAAPACDRHNFTLDFKDIYRSDWVISPKQFHAYYCGGECTFPLSARMNATNHAIVQTLMQLKVPNLPKPCCVPTVLGSISILHYINEDSVNLTKYPQSVAKACGCL